MLNHFIKLFLLIGFSIGQLQAQSNETASVKAVNNYVQYANESTHGMLIISRLLENFNKKVNTYIETQDKEPANYSNGDLPRDIFLDPEKWFYDISPTKLYYKAIEGGSGLSSADAAKMNAVIKDMKKITSNANQFRFKLEEYVNFMNYKDPVFLEKLYVMLEEAVLLFDEFYIQQVILESLVHNQKTKLNLTQSKFEVAYNTYYLSLRDVLSDLRSKDDANIATHIEDYKANYMRFKKISKDNSFSSKRSVRRLKYLGEKSDAIQVSMDNFINDVPVPKEYEAYGKHYFYHNAEMLNKTNKYGNGLISEMNKIIDKEQLSSIMYFEVPHFYRVATRKITWKKRDYKKNKARK